VHVEDVIRVYRHLSGHGIRVWLVGGWGIDALIGEQTRPHHDLDVLVVLDDVPRTRELMASDGYALKELWSENRWVADSRGIKAPTAFVLRDAEGREFDAHAMRLDEQGNGIPA
jgi:lincosamide nucleotidyltransferase A/C/D/E